MHSGIRDAQRSAAYTIRQTASILGVEPSAVSRAIRVGSLRAVRQRGRLVVPARSLVRLLGQPSDFGGDR